LRIRKSWTIALVNNCAKNNIRGKAANHVKMNPKGSGSCIIQEECRVNRRRMWTLTNDLSIDNFFILEPAESKECILISKLWSFFKTIISYVQLYYIKKYKYQEIFILSTFLGLSSGALEWGCVRGAMVRMYRIFGHSLVRNWIRNKVLESGGH